MRYLGKYAISNHFVDKYFRRVYNSDGVICVKYAHYEFDKISNRNDSSYIFQYVCDRRLTDIYHSHDFFELCVVLCGSATEYFNGRSRIITEGTATLIKPYEPHCFTAQSEGMRLACLSVEKEEALQLFETFGVSLPERDIVFKLDNAASLVSEAISSPLPERKYKLLFCRILDILEDCRGESVPYILQNAVRKMRQPENMCLGIPRLTELSGYSRSHLARLVRQYYGCSLQELIIQLRLEEAYKQIILTKDSPEEIAYKVGYSSFSHFQKVFKKTFGVTPAVLRKTRATRTV